LAFPLRLQANGDGAIDGWRQMLGINSAADNIMAKRENKGLVT
jgi:hypothetical protein